MVRVGGEFTLPSQGREVVHLVEHILDGEGKDLDAHPPHIHPGNLPDQGGELVPVAVNLLDSQRGCKEVRIKESTNVVVNIKDSKIVK